MHTESLLARESSGERLGSGLRTSEPMTRTEHSFVIQQQASMQVPPEFGACQIVDQRNVGGKVAAFVGAAAHRATDGKSWKKYFDDECEKVVGIGEGLNSAKEETKKIAGAALHSLVDGSAWNAVMQTPEFLRASVHGGMNLMSALAHDPHAVDKFAASVAVSVCKASDSYTQMPAREKGKVIGEVMFAMVNPEGSTEGAEVALKAADRIATSVDDAVVSGIQKSMKAIEEMQQSAPELAAHARQMLREYTRTLRLTEPELEFAGVPRGYFDTASTAVPVKEDQFFAASRVKRANDWPGELNREVPSSSSETASYRGDKDITYPTNKRGLPKSHINADGDLTPADPVGMYKGTKVTIAQHVNETVCWRAKAHSPYTSFGTTGKVLAKYGDGKGLELDLKGLRDAIAKGEVEGIKIHEHEDVVQSIRNSYFKRYEKIKLLEYVAKDREIAIEGIIPKRFLKLHP